MFLENLKINCVSKFLKNWEENPKKTLVLIIPTLESFRTLSKTSDPELASSIPEIGNDRSMDLSTGLYLVSKLDRTCYPFEHSRLSRNQYIYLKVLSQVLLTTKQVSSEEMSTISFAVFVKFDNFASFHNSKVSVK